MTAEKIVARVIIGVSAAGMATALSFAADIAFGAWWIGLLTFVGCIALASSIVWASWHW